MPVAISLSLAITFASLGDILLSKGMKSVGEAKIRKFRDIPPLLRVVFTHRIVLTGVICMAFYFSAYMTALVWTDVSVANPLTALSYVLATWGGQCFHTRESRQDAMGRSMSYHSGSSFG